MKTALYHQEFRTPVELEVLAENQDGTVDLGREGKLVVGKCAVTEDSAPGSCTIQKQAAPVQEKSEKSKTK